MKKTRLRVLLTIAIVEAVLILGVVLVPWRGMYIVEEHIGYVIPSPLYWALEFEAPDWKFEEVVKANPSWVSYREEGNGETALGRAAILERTNCVRILISNGANVEEEVKRQRADNMEPTATLILAVQSELRRRAVDK